MYLNSQGSYASPSARVGSYSPMAKMEEPALEEEYKLPSKDKKKGNGSKIPSIKKFLGLDTDYQSTLAALKANRNRYNSQNRTDYRQYNDDYNEATTRMEQDQKKSQELLAADYAARGMLGSGLSLKASTDQSNEFGLKRTDAETSYKRNIGQIDTDLANARAQFREDRQQARLNAIRRRAEQYGIRS